MPVTKLSVSLSPEAHAGIALRDESNTSGAISENLERWFEALRRSRREIRHQFSAAECALILDALNGTMHDARTIQLMIAGIEDAINMDALAAKWEVDGVALLEKLDRLTYTETAAIVDGAERWWIRVGSGEQPVHAELLS